MSALDTADLEGLKAMHAKGTLTAADVISHHTLKTAAIVCDFDTCRWLQETLRLTPEQMRSDNNAVTEYAALFGHLGVLKWVAGVCALTDADINWASSSPAITKWMDEAFPNRYRDPILGDFGYPDRTPPQPDNNEPEFTCTCVGASLGPLPVGPPW